MGTGSTVGGERHGSGSPPAISGGSVGSPAPPESPRRYFNFARVADDDAATLRDICKLRYDSTHFCARNERGEMVATLRLVFDSTLGFPLEGHADNLSADYHGLPRDKTAEISRLILAKSYRRRANDGLYGADLGATQGAPQTNVRSQYPLILFGLFREMYMESLGIGLQYWLAAMEPGLQRMLSNFGLGLRQIGDPMSYYGQVIPYYANIEELSRFIMESRPNVFKFFGDAA